MAVMPIISYILIDLLAVVFGGTWCGVSYGARLAIFAITLLCLCISLPIKGYGRVTDKREGSNFTLLPVSTLEKTLSMILISCVAFPFMFILGYGILDLILCTIDPSCGKALCNPGILDIIWEHINSTTDMGIAPEEIRNALSAILNPWLYIDDLIQAILVFLLGAVFFKKSKAAKTILACFVFSIALSMITTPVIYGVLGLNYAKDVTVLFDKLPWVFNHLGLLDTISDTVENVALGALIYFRLKTIKY